MNVALELLLSRRSATTLESPGPTQEELGLLLAAAGSVPDHGQLRPFRFVVVSGEGRGAFGRALAASAQDLNPSLAESKLEGISSKAFRSPTSILVIASPKAGKIEKWEQLATAACAGYSVVLAAHALGIGAVWKSVPFTRGRGLIELLELNPSEELLGWIHLGTSTQDPSVRAPFDVAALTTVIDGDAPRPFRG
ncbi:MAG: putative nitroreductase [Polyangiaceae bacterium]|jgi:nitroreductase|nr:putative nitroreductase [Polyangiaceae bacterium]